MNNTLTNEGIKLASSEIYSFSDKFTIYKTDLRFINDLIKTLNALHIATTVDEIDTTNLFTTVNVTFYGTKSSIIVLFKKYSIHSVTYEKAYLDKKDRKDILNSNELEDIIKKRFKLEEGIQLAETQLYYISAPVRFWKYHEETPRKLALECRKRNINTIILDEKYGYESIYVRFIGTLHDLEYINEHLIDPQYKTIGVFHYKYNRNWNPEFEYKYEIEDYYKKKFGKSINEGIGVAPAKIYSFLLSYNFITEENNKEKEFIKFLRNHNINTVLVNKIKQKYNSSVALSDDFIIRFYGSKYDLEKLKKELEKPEHYPSLKQFKLEQMDYFREENNPSEYENKHDLENLFKNIFNQNIDEGIGLAKNIPTNELPKKGDRVQTIEMIDDLDPIKIGEKGTVEFVDDAKNIHVNWDNGRKLALIYGIDKYKIINEGIKVAKSGWDELPDEIYDFFKGIKNNIKLLYFLQVKNSPTYKLLIKYDKIPNFYKTPYLIYTSFLNSKGEYSTYESSFDNAPIINNDKDAIEWFKNHYKNLSEGIKLAPNKWEYEDILEFKNFIQHRNILGLKNFNLIEYKKINKNIFCVLFSKHSQKYLFAEYDPDITKNDQYRFTVIEKCDTEEECKQKFNDYKINEGIGIAKPQMPEGLPEKLTYEKLLNYIENNITKNKDIKYIKVLDYFNGDDFHKDWPGINKNHFYILININNLWMILNYDVEKDILDLFDNYRINDIDSWPILFKQGFKNIMKDHAQCPFCKHIFNYINEPEAGMGYVKCPECGEAVTQNNLIENKYKKKVNEGIKLPQSQWAKSQIPGLYDFINKIQPQYVNYYNILKYFYKKPYYYILFKLHQKPFKEFYISLKYTPNDKRKTIDADFFKDFNSEDDAIKYFDNFYKNVINEAI